MMFSEDEALCVVDLLKEKSGVIKEALKKVSSCDQFLKVYHVRHAVVVNLHSCSSYPYNHI